jgi:hypothetical protein
MTFPDDSPKARRPANGSRGGPLRPPRGRFHYNLGSLLLLMVIFSLAAAGLSYLVRAERGGGRESQLIFLLLVLVGPVALLLVVSWIHKLTGFGVETEEFSPSRNDQGVPGESDPGADDRPE